MTASAISAWPTKWRSTGRITKAINSASPSMMFACYPTGLRSLSANLAFSPASASASFMDRVPELYIGFLAF